MSEIAEIRKLFQDLEAPDVKSVATDLAALKTNVDHQFRSAEDLAKGRHGAVLAKIETMETRLSSMETRLSSVETMQAIRHEAILKALGIDKRLERVEAPGSNHSRLALCLPIQCENRRNAATLTSWQTLRPEAALRRRQLADHAG